MKMPLLTPPGRSYRSSNPGYSILAAIVEELTGPSLRALPRRAAVRPDRGAPAWRLTSPTRTTCAWRSGSRGSPSAPTATRWPDGPLSRGHVHLRSYGTSGRIFERYVRELELVRLEDAARRASSLPAQRLGIRDRGLRREDFYADVVVFDTDPHRFCDGVDYVLVNGAVVLDQGQITDARPGMVIRGPGYRAR